MWHLLAHNGKHSSGCITRLFLIRVHYAIIVLSYFAILLIPISYVNFDDFHAKSTICQTRRRICYDVFVRLCFDTLPNLFIHLVKREKVFYEIKWKVCTCQATIDDACTWVWFTWICHFLGLFINHALICCICWE